VREAECAECHEIRQPKPLGALWATQGLLRDCFTFYCNSNVNRKYWAIFVHNCPSDPESGLQRSGIQRDNCRL